MTRTQQTSYAQGYQDALKDIAAALDADGEDGVKTWLADNLGREDLRKQQHQDDEVPTVAAQLLPAIPGFPETPVTVISEIAGSHDPIRYQIRIDGSGAYAAVPAHRLRFGGAR